MAGQYLIFPAHLPPPSLPLQRQQLLHLGVPSLFIAVALDEGPGPPLRSPYADLSKLYAVVGILVRSCDVSIMQKSVFEVRRFGMCSLSSPLSPYFSSKPLYLSDFFSPASLSFSK